MQKKKNIEESVNNVKALEKDFAEAKKIRKESRINLDEASADRLQYINENATRPRKYGPEQAPELMEVKQNLEEAKIAVAQGQKRVKNAKKMVEQAQTMDENERAYIEHIIAKHEFAEANSKLIKA